jgi:hypothetical protein
MNYSTLGATIRKDSEPRMAIHTDPKTGKVTRLTAGDYTALQNDSSILGAARVMVQANCLAGHDLAGYMSNVTVVKAA